MKILVVDEYSKRRAQIVEILEKNGHDVEGCSTTQDFMVKIDEDTPERLVLDVPTWRNGKAIYQYFQLGKKLEKIPILFYNSYEGFSFDGTRAPHENDRILHEPTKSEDIGTALEQAA